MNFNLGREGYTPDRGQIFYEQAAERIAALPGVTRAAIAQNAPLAGGLLRSVFPEGADTTTRDRILVQVNSVSAGYFDTIGIPLLRGRDFTRADTTGAPLVVIVNETMAERFWPNQDAIGKRFKFFGDAGFTTIIGVARNSKYNGVAEEPIPFIYQPLLQNYTPQATLLARAETHAAGLAGARSAAKCGEIDPTLLALQRPDAGRSGLRVAGAAPHECRHHGRVRLAGAALASIGLYGVASYNGDAAHARDRRADGPRRQARQRAALDLLHAVLLVAVGVVTGLARGDGAHVVRARGASPERRRTRSDDVCGHGRAA